MKRMEVFVYVLSKEIGISLPTNKDELLAWIDKRLLRYHFEDQLRILFGFNYVLQCETTEVNKRWQLDVLSRLLKYIPRVRENGSPAVFTRWGVLFLLQRLLKQYNTNSQVTKKRLLPDGKISTYAKKNYYDVEIRRYLMILVATNELMPDAGLIRSVIIERLPPFETVLFSLRRTLVMYSAYLTKYRDHSDISRIYEKIHNDSGFYKSLVEKIKAVSLLSIYFRYPASFNQREYGIDLAKVGSYLIKKSNFEKSPEIISMLNQESVSLTNAKSRIMLQPISDGEVSVMENFNLFYEYPFVEVRPDEYILIDPQFLAEKYIYGIPLLLKKTFSVDATDTFTTHGRLLEKYFISNMNSINKKATEESNEEDYRLENDNQVMLFEVTKEFIPANYAYATKDKVFLDRMEKFLFGDPSLGKRKGKGKLIQLHEYMLKVSKPKSCIGVLVTERYIGNPNFYLLLSGAKNWLAEKCTEYKLFLFNDNLPVFVSIDDFEHIFSRYKGTSENLQLRISEYQKSLHPFLTDYMEEKGELTPFFDEVKKAVNEIKNFPSTVE